MEHGSARELLRASATDADAVRQYLQSIEANELEGLLDGIAPRTSKTKKKSEFLVKEDWLPLVHALVQCEATRLRAASRIIQVLRRGSPSELESMQLLTEISLGYSSALDGLQELKEKIQRTQHSVKRQKLLEEIRTVLDIMFSFLEEVVKDVTPTNGKVLPQLLGLVPYFLNLSEELKDGDVGASENLARLLELPWSCQTVPTLLNVLVEDSSLMSRDSWQHLQVTVERMVTTTPEMASETMNPIIRECVLVANVSGDHKWIGIVRYLLRQLPVHLRQVAEFNLQMCFNQSPRIAVLVCESIRSSKVPGDGDIGREIATPPFDEHECGVADLKIDWRDLFLLLHCLQSSRPVLHHRTSSSRVATEAAVFSEIEQLVWCIVQSDLETFLSPTTNGSDSRTTGKTIGTHVRDQVELLLSFGGKQIHSRQWKALLLMDMAFFWIELSNGVAEDKTSTSKTSSALMLLQAIFEMAPETRAEVLSSLFECSQKPAMKKIAGETISQLFISQADKLFPHLNSIQDWLSLEFQRSLDGAREFFQIASRLATRYKDLYNFLMIFLRKLLSTGNRSHQQFAVDMWCTWLDHRLPFNEQQEEEIISALKNSIAACHDIQAWSFGRLEQVFQCDDTSIEVPVISLRKCSWEEVHRFLSQEVGKFIVPKMSGFVRFGNEDSSDDYDDEDSGLSRFEFTSLDGFYQQNASLDGAASIGLIFQKLLSCLIQFGKAVSQAKISSEGLPIEGLNDKESDIKQWLADVVSNWKYFFHWVCLDSNELLNQSAQGRFCEKSAWWKLVARIYIGCGICNLVIEMLLWTRPAGGFDDRDSTNQDSVVFCADGGGVSIWSLMEMEFSLHRMLHKLVSQYSNEMDTSLSKEFVRASSYGLHTVLQPKKLQILTAIKHIFEEPTSNSPQERRHGISYDTVMFTLDSCWSAIGEEHPFEELNPRDNVDGRISEAGSIFYKLLCIYINIRDRVVTDNFGVDDDNGDKRDEMKSRLHFSLFADSISAKYPASARQLVAPGKKAKAIVLLDGKAGEELLEHICAALGRTLEAMLKASSILSMNAEVGQVLQITSWGGPVINSGDMGGSKNHLMRLSHYFLSDVEKCAQQDGLTKLGVACAMLSKRLQDIAAESADDYVVCSDALSSLAYSVMCENVVYNSRLLRVLMDICLPTHLTRHIKTFVALESKINGIMQSCGFNLADVAASSSNTSYDRRHESRKSATRRKRLRQDVAGRSRHGLQVGSESESDDSYSSGFDNESDASSAAIDSNTNSVGFKLASSSNCGRIPHLQSHTSQSIAILAVLAALDQAQATLLDVITATNQNESTLPLHHHDILSYIRIHELVSKAISNNRNFSWGARKVILKILHMIELGLRIGKASGLRKGLPEVELSNVCIYESSVTSALRARTWVSSVKDASQDSGTKAKVSATLLKMDIFLLQVPGTVQTWLKETTACDEAKKRLKTLVALVKDKIAPTEQTNDSRGKAKSRQRLLGVVPIVRKRRKRLRSRHPIIDAFLNEEDGRDAFADLEDFIE